MHNNPIHIGFTGKQPTQNDFWRIDCCAPIYSEDAWDRLTDWFLHIGKSLALCCLPRTAQDEPYLMRQVRLCNDTLASVSFRAINPTKGLPFGHDRLILALLMDSARRQKSRRISISPTEDNFEIFEGLRGQITLDQIWDSIRRLSNLQIVIGYESDTLDQQRTIGDLIFSSHALPFRKTDNKGVLTTPYNSNIHIEYFLEFSHLFSNIFFGHIFFPQDSITNFFRKSPMEWEIQTFLMMQHNWLARGERLAIPVCLIEDLFGSGIDGLKGLTSEHPRGTVQQMTSDNPRFELRAGIHCPVLYLEGFL